MMEQKGCLQINVKSWHYRMCKFVWGKRWDQNFDTLGYIIANEKWVTNTIDLMSESPEDHAHPPRPNHDDYWKDINLSLCPYARKVLFGLIALPLVALGTLLLRVPAPTLPKVNMSREIKNSISRILKVSLVTTLIIGIGYGLIISEWFRYLIGGFIVVGGSVILSIWLTYRLSTRTSDWRYRHPLPHLPRRKNHVPSKRFNGLKEFIHLINAYIHARHDKVCPCLERVSH